jgi:DNA-binding response OmpR family regulator
MKPRSTRHKMFAATETADKRRRIELPELFEVEADGDEQALPHDTSQPEPDRSVLLVARSPALKNFLVPVFLREGRHTFVASTREEIDLILAEERIGHILVAQDVLEEFSKWMAEGAGAPVGVELSVLSTVSGTLLDNPASYSKMLRAVFSAVQILAEDRLAHAGVSAPYALVTRDVRDLAKVFGLRRIATDGVQVAAWLLTPAPPSTPAPFRDLARSIAHARALAFPWRIDALLEKTRGLFAGEEHPTVGATLQEIDVAAQILAIAWYRHAVGVGDLPEDTPSVKGRLRAAVGRVASLEVVESYIRILESAGADSERRQVVVVSLADDMVKEMMPRFGRMGINIEHKHSMSDARPYCEATPPVAVMVDFSTLGMEAARLSVVLRLIPNLMLYAIVESSDPAITLDLIDAGFDDVLAPPLDWDVVAARVSRAARGLARKQARESVGFRGTFASFSFVDLIQSLSQSRKSVRVDLLRGDGEGAVIYIDGGKLVHGRAGSNAGNEAVYRVVTWGDDGSFTVEPISTFPAANISDPTEAVLMEGCRLLDESQAEV